MFGDFYRWARYEAGLYFVAIYGAGFFAGILFYSAYISYINN